MTNEPLSLGESDSVVRWFGMPRHQLLHAACGVAAFFYWFIRDRSNMPLLVFAVATCVFALVRYDGLSAPQWLRVVLSYQSRSRWTALRVEARADDTTELEARGNAVFRVFELVHRGRLDLTEADTSLANDVASLLNVVGRRTSGGHVSLHSWGNGSDIATALCVEPDVGVAASWRPRPEALCEMLGLGVAPNATWLLERWRYVRLNDDVLAVYRVEDFSTATTTSALLRDVQRFGVFRWVSLHAAVLPSRTAHRLVGRALHQVRSDSALSGLVGYRRTARSDLRHERLRQRELATAKGTALVQLAVYIVIRASSLQELRSCSSQLQRDAERAGLQLRLGAGRQAMWFCAQLPGDAQW
jgi:hypothetical protein